MYILEDYLSNARKKLKELEEQLETWTRKKEEELAGRRLNRSKHYQDPGLDAFNRDMEKEKARFVRKIESVKYEIGDLEKKIASEDYQLLKSVHAGLESIRQRAHVEWRNGGTEQEFHAQWIQLQKDALKAKTLEAIEQASNSSMIELKQRVRWYWLALDGTEDEYEKQWAQLQKDAFRETTLEAIEKGIEPIFSKTRVLFPGE